ncbi:uncharacterized mitochondrial protein-like protein [Tanacetum coccineum]
MSSMGELAFFLGLQVTQKDDEIFISQDKYVNEILKKFGFSTVKIANTPMETSNPLLKDVEAEDIDVHLYRSMIRSLMYLTASRPNIMFAVCACARFQVTPKVSHLHAVKRIFRYLKGQPKLGLWYPKDSPFDLEAYTDSDYAGASLDRKYTIGDCNGYLLKDKNKAKTDKTKHGNGKSVKKSKSQSQKVNKSKTKPNPKKSLMGQPPEPKLSSSVEDDTIDEPIVQALNGSVSLQVNISDESYPKSLKEARGHPIEQVIGELNERTLRSKTKQA